MRYFTAMRTASNAASKQSDGDLRGDDRQRRLAVAAVHREQQVGLLGLGRQAGRRAAALHVDEHHRQLEADREPDRLRLEVDAGTARAGDREAAGERGADRGARGGDLVFGLQRLHAEVLQLRQLVQDVGRGRDRVRRVEQRQLRLLRGGDEPVRQRDVAGDVAVRAGRAAARASPRTGGRTARRSRRSCSRPGTRRGSPRAPRAGSRSAS